jgi:hypothetical protein
VPEQKICYYTIHRDATGEKRVRFGTSCRREAQIDVGLAQWERICLLIASNGCRLVKINGTPHDR